MIGRAAEARAAASIGAATLVGLLAVVASSIRTAQSRPVLLTWAESRPVLFPHRQSHRRFQRRLPEHW
jgi:hypothetical protein